MPDKDGENSGESKTYTQADMDAALATAKTEGNKDGQTAAHAHWQSVGDKAIAQLSKEYEGKLTQQNSVIADLQKARLETMSPEDRSAAMMQQLLERMDGNGAKDASDKSNPFDRTAESQQDKAPVTDQSAALAQQRKEMGDSLATKFGIDATKLDWADGESGTAAMDKFMSSFAEAVKLAQTKSDQDDPNHVDTKNSPSGTAFDINTGDPKDLIRAGAGTVRPSTDGGYRTAPWL